jgi:formyl-CoA transferase
MVRILGGIPVVGSPVRIDGERADADLPPPAVGQHTDEVLRTLGLEPREIERLKSEGVAG